jgi:hypothetical protein
MENKRFKGYMESRNSFNISMLQARGFLEAFYKTAALPIELRRQMTKFISLKMYEMLHRKYVNILSANPMTFKILLLEVNPK